MCSRYFNKNNLLAFSKNLGKPIHLHPQKIVTHSPSISFVDATVLNFIKDSCDWIFNQIVFNPLNYYSYKENLQ